MVRNFIFLIDEAELHLHPSAQRSLKQALAEIIGNGGQVFINSHSSIFATDELDNQKVFEVLKFDGESTIKSIQTEQERLDAIYGLLGGSPNDLLLPRNFLIVEGQSELLFIQNVISRFYAEEAKNIKILFARGDAKKQSDVYFRIAEAYTPLHTNGVYKDKVVFLFDKPNATNQKNYDKFLTFHPWLGDGEHYHTLDEETLEESYPNHWKKKKGEIDDKQKTTYAQEVGISISQDEFENGMPVVYNALMKVIEKAFL